MRRDFSIRSIIWWTLRIVNLTLLFSIAAVGGLLLGTYSGISEVIPNARDLGELRPGQASRVLSAEGELLATVATENREFVSLERIPEALQQAAVATEDREFYQHIGVNPRAILRAAFYDVVAWGPRQGGSTITQQLVRNVYLTRTKTLARKLAELVLALQLERAYTKPEILELYLNQIYFGEGAYGVQVASRTYFGKDVWDLSTAECALLAGLPKRPEYYSPFEDEQRATDRRNYVLATMAEQGHLTPEEMEEAQAAPLELVEDKRPLGLSSYQAPYFTNYVLREVARQYGPDALYQGGLTIHSTLNLEMQRAAEEATAWGLAQAERRGFRVDQIALAAVDTRTGAIRAMVGGADYSESQYNRTVQGGRQAGSSFKPFVYTAALEQGFSPDSTVEDSPVSYPGRPGQVWTPRNYDEEYHGRVTFRQALTRSYNVATVKVAAMAGVGSVIATAERMGIHHPMENQLPLAIGYCDVGPLEMASAFSVYATRGMRTEPYGIQRIVDARGRVVQEHRSLTWRVLNENVAELMVDMLAEVIRSGTGAGIRRQLSFPAAGKTGTSNDFRDAWFIGFTDDLCAAVWMGNDDFSSTGRQGRTGVSGATIPAPVWARFMRVAQPLAGSAHPEREQPRVIEINPSTQGSPRAPVPPDAPEPRGNGEEGAGGEGVDQGRILTKWICPTSGLLAGPHCPTPVEVTYDVESGAEAPEKTCDTHAAGGEQGSTEAPRNARPAEPARGTSRGGAQVSLSVCAITNQLASSYCPIVIRKAFSAEEAPTATCERHGPRPPGP